MSIPVRSLTGETLVAIDARHWQLEPWLPGVADFHSHPTQQRLRSAMAALACWHDAAVKFRPDAEYREWFESRPEAPSPAVNERLTRLRQLTPLKFQSLSSAIQQESAAFCRQLCSEMLDRIRWHRDGVIARLEALSRERFALQPCLRDIWHDHVLFIGDEVSGLIDPSACRTENVATDLARLLGSLIEDDAARWQSALDQYRKHHPLTLSEEALVVALDKSGVILSALTWLEWLFLERRSFPDATKANERLQWLLRRMQKL